MPAEAKSVFNKSVSISFRLKDPATATAKDTVTAYSAGNSRTNTEW
jgi:hypothetical protein